LRTNIHFWLYLTKFFLEWEMFQIEALEKTTTHICMCTNFFFFRKQYSLYEIIWKYCTAVQATDDNLAHPYCMLDTEGYKCTLKIINTFCFSTATMVAQTRLIVNVIRTLFVLYSFVIILSVNMHCKPSFNVAVTFLTITTCSETN
jgi:hypothetical protein